MTPSDRAELRQLAANGPSAIVLEQWIEALEQKPLIEAAILDSTEMRSAESDIPDGEPCPICGPKGHGRHEDDSYGSCVRCYTYVAHSDTVYEHVAWPCPAARLAESEAQMAALLEWAEEREREVRGEDWAFGPAYANAFRDEFIPRLRAALQKEDE